MRLAVAEQKFAISGEPARHIIGPLGEGADPAHAREDVHILFGGLELVERAGRGAVEIEPEEVGGSEHADRIIGIRSVERRVGNERVSTVNSRWWPYN